MHISTWLFGDGFAWWRGAWGSLVFPTLVVVATLIRCRQEWTLEFWALLAGTAVASLVSGQWQQDSDSISLSLLPVFFISLAFLAYWKTPLHPAVAFSGCFLSLVSADVISTLLHFKADAAAARYLGGVGGAGLQDGLFMFPVLSYLLEHYVRWRLNPSVLKPDSL